jgi:hypothetical protein
MTKFYVDAEGNYLGGFENAEPPLGALEVSFPPEHGWDKWDGNSWIAYTKTAEENKEIALQLLQKTDWTTFSDVNNPEMSNPYLANQSEFIEYRNAIRKFAVYPQSGEVNFPELPVENWVKY